MLVVVACGSPQPPNVVLIVIDTLRVDRVGVHGNPRKLTPAIDGVAAGGSVFKRAYAQSSWTNASVASLLTSRYQSQHGVLDFSSNLPDSEVALAEILAEAGYATGGFSAHSGISNERGFSQGFQRFDDVPMQRAAPAGRDWLHERAQVVNERALVWLDSLRETKPVFLYLHYMEPHPPYQPSAGAVSLLVQQESWKLLSRVNGHLRFSKRDPISEQMMGVILDFYAAEILSVDRSIDALLGGLQERNILANSLLVITSDHGEEFRERDGIGHGVTLFEEVIHVPLIMARSGLVPPAEVDTVVSLIDVAPTIADFAGIELPASFEGHSLRRLLERGADPQLPGTALSELDRSPLAGARRKPNHRRAWVSGDWKLIAGREGVDDEFYFLGEDPSERAGDAGSAADKRRLRDALGRAVEGASRNPAIQTQTPIDPETLEKLRALGYAD